MMRSPSGLQKAFRTASVRRNSKGIAISDLAERDLDHGRTAIGDFRSKTAVDIARGAPVRSRGPRVPLSIGTGPKDVMLDWRGR